MGRRLTDRKAVYVALLLARDYEESLIDAYRNVDENAPGVQLARKHIAAFERVLNRYFGGVPDEKLPTGKVVSITELMAPKEPRQFDPENND